MDVKVNETPKKKIKGFPKLMSSRSGTIVLFYTEHCGVCLRNTGSNTPVGQYLDHWRMEFFEDFEGEVTLSN
jgi:hypothetical protein